MESTTYLESDEFIELIPNLNKKDLDLTLKRMQNALIAMGNPCQSIPAIQIAGTNGKGSIANFISSGLKSLDIKAGTTTSPHLISWCERISTNGTNISPKELRERLNNLKSIINNFELTPFESLIASALDYFNDQSVELIVLEVGLGGRLDATTAHSYRPIIAMAGIGLDHCEHLDQEQLNLETLDEIFQELLLHL